MKPNGFLKWDIDSISNVLKITPEEVKEYFTDGRRVSFMLERRISKEIIKGTLALSEGAGYDLLDQDGKKWEVRSITRGGCYFCPSYMVGSGRRFEENGFLNKLNEIEGYILSDVESFPTIPYWIINKSVVKNWYDNNKLGSGTSSSRNRVLQLINNL